MPKGDNTNKSSINHPKPYQAKVKKDGSGGQQPKKTSKPKKESVPVAPPKARAIIIASDAAFQQMTMANWKKFVHITALSPECVKILDNKKLPPVEDLPEVDPDHPVKLILMDIMDVQFEQTFSNLASATSTVTGPRTEAGKKDTWAAVDTVEKFLTNMKARYLSSLNTVILLVDRSASEASRNVVWEGRSREPEPGINDLDHTPEFIRVINRLRPPSPD